MTRNSGIVKSLGIPELQSIARLFKSVDIELYGFLFFIFVGVLIPHTFTMMIVFNYH